MQDPAPCSADLVLAAAQGDPRAGTRCWDEYSVLVRGVIRRALGRSDDVEDLVQETFLRLFREAPRLRDKGKVRSFVLGIALNVVRDEWRRRRVRKWLCLTDHGFLPDLEAPDDSDARRAVRRLYEILELLEPNSRIAFSLRYFEELELDEAADVMGCSLATMKRYLAHARERVEARASRDASLLPYLGAGSAQEAP